MKQGVFELQLSPSVWAALLLGAVVILLVLLAPRLWNTVAQYLAFRRVPTDPEGQHWLLGHSPKLLSDMGAALDWFTGHYVKYGWKSSRVIMGPFWYMLSCLHPDTCKEVLRGDPKSDLIYNALEPWLGKGLLVANGARWARSRRLLTPAFHFDILRPYAHVFADCSQTLVREWSKVPQGQSFNAFPYISLLTLDVMLRCTCSFNSNCQTNKTHDPYISAVFDLSTLTTRRILFFPAYYDWVYALMPDGFRYRKACRIVHRFSRDVVQLRRKALKEMKMNGSERENGTEKVNGGSSKRKYLDFIDILLEARDEAGNGLTDEEIRAEVDTFMFEGHDTTASGITWALYNLARHPEHQELCRREVDAVFSEKDEMDWDDLRQLTYLKYCIKESMRLFPPVSSHGRMLEKEKEIDGKIFPAGTRVVIVPYSVHRCPDIWDNPEEFDPLRFSPENSKGRHPHAYIPFAAGPRNCIGQEFAMNEMKAALATLLHHFELTLDPDHPPQKDLQLILRPKDGLFLKLKHRNL